MMKGAGESRVLSLKLTLRLEWLNEERSKKFHQNKSDNLPEILLLPSGSTTFSWELELFLSIATILFLTRSSFCWKNCPELKGFMVEIKFNNKNVMCHSMLSFGSFMFTFECEKLYRATRSEVFI